MQSGAISRWGSHRCGARGEQMHLMFHRNNDVGAFDKMLEPPIRVTQCRGRCHVTPRPSVARPAPLSPSFYQTISDKPQHTKCQVLNFPGLMLDHAITGPADLRWSTRTVSTRMSSGLYPEAQIASPQISSTIGTRRWLPPAFHFPDRTRRKPLASACLCAQPA